MLPRLRGQMRAGEGMSLVTTDLRDCIHVDLTDGEREVLRAGIVEWGGPVRVTQELAVAMGSGTKRTHSWRATAS